MIYNFDYKPAILMEQYDSMPKDVREAIAGNEDFIHITDVYIDLMYQTEIEVVKRIKKGYFS